MKKILFSILIMPLFCFGWYPHKTSSEIRVIAVNTLENFKNFNDWDISGQLLQKKISEQSQIGAMFSLGSREKESKIGAHYTYSVNKYVDVAFSGDVSQHQNFGGSFWVNLNVFYKGFELKPFFNVDHRTLSELGLIVYKKIGESFFNFGVAYSPHVSLTGNKESKESTISLLFGTSFENLGKLIPLGGK